MTTLKDFEENKVINEYQLKIVSELYFIYKNNKLWYSFYDLKQALKFVDENVLHL